MKRIFMLNCLLALISFIACGDAYEWRRNNCGFVGNRYFTHAETNKIGGNSYYTVSGYDEHNACSGTVQSFSHGIYHIPNTGVWLSNAYCGAQCGSAGDGTNSHVDVGYSAIYSNGANTTLTNPEFSYSPIYENESSHNSNLLGSTASFQSSEIEFNKERHSVIMKNIQATIGVDDPDKANAYSTLKISIYDETGINIENGGKLIKTLQAFIFNGNLILEGDFSEKEFTKNESKDFYYINGLDKEIKIDSRIDLDNISIKIASDNGNLGNGISDEYKIDLNQERYSNLVSQVKDNKGIKINILQNPVENNLKINIDKSTNQFNNASINIYSLDGKLVDKIYNGNFNDIQDNYSINVSNYNAGAYYITLLTDNREKFTKKFIKK